MKKRRPLSKQQQPKVPGQVGRDFMRKFREAMKAKRLAEERENERQG